jgi:NADPH-dependent 2,4-dienoyl-CoA reductase/sulfur reductase-like enzyme
MKYAFDILVVGAGPAGLAAATAAAGAGRSVALLDENPHVGGQIWRSAVGQSHPDRLKSQAVAKFIASKATLFSGRQVMDADASGTLSAWVNSSQTLETFTFDKLILATGARERFLPFPGWTLPGVFGAGGLQALARGGYDIRGKRVVVAGTGPLLLAVAAHLKQDGAIVVMIAEQAPLSRLVSFGRTLLSHPAKLMQGMHLRAQLAGTPYRMGCWPVKAEGEGSLRSVTFTNGSRTWTEPCDLLACGFHLVPNVELAMLLGCQVDQTGVQVDTEQRTSLQNIYCAGEPTGIAGLDAAMVQGEIAGLSAAGQTTRAAQSFRKRNAQIAFGRAMDRAFALRDELRTLAQSDTIVCRCEDVSFGQVQAQEQQEASAHASGHVSGQASWTHAKLQTRCGMGSCQGRVCGPALNALFGWRNMSVRSPLFPVPVAALCSVPRSEPRSEDEIKIPVLQENSR